MSCNICAESPDDTTKLINVFSDEGKRLKSQEIIQKHFWFEINPISQHSYGICHNCWQIISNFHQLYLRVEQTNLKLCAEHECGGDNTDSDSEPLAALRKELKLENSVVKLEPITCLDTTKTVSETTIKRRSRRLAQNLRLEFSASSTTTLPEPHLPFEYKCLTDNEIVIKNELATTADSIEMDTLMDNLNEHDYELRADEQTASVSGTDDKDLLNILDAPTQHKKASKKDSNFKRRGRPRGSVTIKQEVSTAAQKQHSLKTQVSKQFDEYLAKNFKLSCCLCQAPMADFSKLKTHFRQQHHTKGYVLCCGKKLIKRGVLVDHIRTHVDPEYFKCSKCNKVAASRRCLELHMNRHEEKRERTFHCKICSKSYFRRPIFMRHLLLHVPEDEKKVNCPQCDKVFATYYIMNQHLKLVHLNLYAKICDICGKSIRGREAFQRHQLEHAGMPKPDVECELCGLKLTNKYGLARHMKVRHTEENLRPKECSICSKVSPTISAHQRHMNYVHNMQRKHACPMCDKAFKRPKGLQEHMTTHTGEVLYTCPHCPKTFNSNANMHSHRKKVHRKEWEEKRIERYPKPNGLSARLSKKSELEQILDLESNACKANLFTADTENNETAT